MKFGRCSLDEVLGFDHKTVIVLDHSSSFGKLADQKMNLSLKDPLTGQMRVACCVQKSLWSYAVESSLELHRIVDEIYPDGSRLMRFVISDFVARCLNVQWGSRLIGCEQLLKLFSRCGMPRQEADASCSIINGISMAVEALSELTELQKKNVLLRRGEDDLLRSDLFSAAISNMKYESLSEKERIVSVAHSKISQKHAIQHDGETLKRKKAQDEVIKGKLLYYAKSVKVLSTDEEKQTSQNRGSIIIFSSLEGEDDVASIEHQVYEEIINRNKVVRDLDIEGEDRNFALITHVNLYVINLRTSADAGKGVVAKSLIQVNDFLSSSVICAEVGVSLPMIIRGIAVNHYDLASTTVTGIPMKEEAQQGQSVNYDVEILHLRRAHKILDDCGLIGPESKLRSHLLPGGYDTIKLAWCTSSLKSQCVQYSRCVSVSTISPANVNSRPSVCLTSFLLGHRNVMLEVPKQMFQDSSAFTASPNQKVLSHLLMCYAGRIYVHTMYLGSHPVMDDEVMFSSSTLPKVDPQQLRSSDFVSLARDCQLKYESQTSGTKSSTLKNQLYNESARKRLKRFTRFWPVMLSDAFIYNIPSRFEPLLSLVRKDELLPSDVNKCRECICGLVACRDSKDPLTMKTFECKKLKKLQNREEQLRIAMREILHHLLNYANNSDKHMEVYNMFLQLSGLDRSINLPTSDVVLTESNELCAPSTSLENVARTQSVIETHAKSPSEPPSRSPSSDSLQSQSRSNSPLAKRPRKERKWPGDEIKARDFFYDELQKKRWSRWIDCIGRAKNIPLYANHEFNDDVKSNDIKAA